MSKFPCRARKFLIEFHRNRAPIGPSTGCERCIHNQRLHAQRNICGPSSRFARNFSSENKKVDDHLRTTESHVSKIQPGERKPTSDPLPKTYQPKYVESSWYSWWKTKGFFSPDLKIVDSNSEGKFVLCLPPPNVTGHLHLGHALTVSVQDAIIRWNRMRGVRTLWVPGCDHAGIATQVIVEKQLWKEKKLSRFDLGREKFVDEVWKWKNEKGDHIYKQMERLGASLDWERDCFTMDEKLSRAVTEAFCLLHERGLIYRSHRLVNWSSRLKSAISDIEVEDLELEGRTMLNVPGYDRKVEFGTLTSFAYKIDNPSGQEDEIVVATTRVETMLGDVAVAVHPDDKRYRHLHGAKLLHPFVPERRLDVIADDFVDPNFGTGAVKITPGHDRSDYDVASRHGLDIIDIMDDDGKIITEHSQFQGLHRFAARWRLTEALKSRDLYRGCQDNPMTIPICSRTGDVIEPRLKHQWFVICDVMASRALAAVQSGRLLVEPTNHERVWCDWLGKSRDWCVSRQLWWGHRIPAYHVTSRKRDSVDLWVSGRNYYEALANAAQSTGLNGDDLILEQDEDVLDTWFSSALFPFSVFGWPEKNVSSEVNDRLVQQFAYLFFWVARMVMMGEELTGRLPFERVLLHGMVRDAHGRKMSKSLGNVVDPMDVIGGSSLEALHKQVESANLDKKEIAKAKQGQKRDFPNGIPECGADALRMTLCSYNFKNEFTNMNVEHVRSARNFCNKLWQAFRFYDRHLPSDYRPVELSPTRPADRWILSRLGHVIGDCDVTMNNSDLHLAAQSVQHFLHHQLCDVYLECVKPDLESSSDPAVLSSIHHTLHSCMDSGLRLLHPFMPYITEELYQRLRGSRTHESISISPYPTPEQSPPRDLDLETAMTVVRQMASRVLHTKNVYNLSATRPNVRIECHVTDCGPIAELHRELISLSRSHDLVLVTEAPIGWLEESYDDVTVYVDVNGLDLAAMLDDVTSKRQRCESQLTALKQKKDASDSEKKVDKLSSEVSEWRARVEQIRRLLAER